MKEYNFQEIEAKWQKKFGELKPFKAEKSSKKDKFFVLVEFPYPSGAGLHVGHCRSYVALDIISRKRRAEGYNVLFPIGWDAFGLPTENYAIKTGVHPAQATKENSDNYRRQLKQLGFSFDWDREINTTDPKYYKWTQWIFIQLFKNGMAYKTKMSINWCPSCKIGLANEEVIDGSCERCGTKVEKREKEQWMLKITDYANRLINDLDNVDYPERVKISQKEWIGKSEGWQIKFEITKSTSKIEVFTTRIDTLFGCTYMVLSPEHPVIEKFKSRITNYEVVEKYIKEAKQKSERERAVDAKEKTGVEIKGIVAKNPATGKDIPIFVADYVLGHYGTGAVMAVPSHDSRDFDFAKKYDLPIIDVIKPVGELSARTEGKAFEGEGILMNSGRFDGMLSKSAKEKIGQWLVEKKSAEKKIYFKLRDWIFSRQRYWGEPIPMIKCDKCGWQPAPEKDLPIELPQINDYKPSDDGESPLVKAKDWVKTKCPVCQGSAERETDVMPNWAGSNWYYLRYCDPDNNKKLAGDSALKYWMPVDWYNGGMEHTTLHLLYSRFIFKFLWDIGAVPKSLGNEPYKKRTSHGMVLGEGSVKMSKSKGNVVNPEQIANEFGADTLRVYEMFMGPFEQMIPWDTKGVKGSKRFLEKIWTLSQELIEKGKDEKTSPKIEKALNQVIKKATTDIEALKFNTIVSAMMEFVNIWSDDKTKISKSDLKSFLIVLSVFAPFISEEIWKELKFSGLCSQAKWPKYNASLIKEEKINLIIQINGKVRDKVEVDFDVDEETAKKIALNQEKIKSWIQSKEIKKIIFVPNKLVNIVTIDN